MQDLETRFSLTHYEDPKGALFKLTHRGSVNDYLTEFERLANRIIGLPPPFLLSCFIFNLAPKIRWEVLALQPISLPQATALAKLQEDKILDRRRTYRPNPPTPSNTLPPPPTPTPSQSPRQPFIHRTPEEMALRRDKGLCYNCNDKWSTSHKCRGRILLLIAETNEAPPDPNLTTNHISYPPNTEPPDPPPDDPTPHISFNALSGLTAPVTFCLYGFIHHNCVTVLIDNGSTHSFI